MEVTNSNIRKILNHLVTLRASCEEGMSGEWDSGSQEGREAFQPMIDEIESIASELNIDLDTPAVLEEECKHPAASIEIIGSDGSLMCKLCGETRKNYLVF